MRRCSVSAIFVQKRVYADFMILKCIAGNLHGKKLKKHTCFHVGDHLRFYNNIFKWWYEIQDFYQLTDGPFTDMNKSAIPARFGLTDYRCRVNEQIELQPWKDFSVQVCSSSNKHGNIFKDDANVPEWWNDYNSVKHSRVLAMNHGDGLSNYARANLGNVSNELAALYILEKAFMDSIGTYDDLSSFMDLSEIFVRRRRYTFEEMDKIYGNH